MIYLELAQGLEELIGCWAGHHQLCALVDTAAQRRVSPHCPAVGHWREELPGLDGSLHLHTPHAHTTPPPCQVWGRAHITTRRLSNTSHKVI